MKRSGLFLLASAILMVFACQKNPVEGTVDTTSVFFSSASKIYVLNEGGMGANNASLDFFTPSDGSYTTGAFKKANPSVNGGLGDVGNDICVIGNEVWIAVNNSGIVEVISAADEKEIAAIEVPTPRSIAFDANYAYVTSWAGAYSNYLNPEDYSNPKGQVYRIDLKTKTVAGSVEVGYQPEGIAHYNGNLYVANSGGLCLPPSYEYDNTVSIIETATFTVKSTVSVQVNLQKVFADSYGNIYVSTFGDYYSVHSGLYMMNADGSNVSYIADLASVVAFSGDTVYCLGAPEEWDWAAEKHWEGFSCTGGVKKLWNITLEDAPYSLCVAGPDTFLIGDAGDYFNPGTVNCYNGGKKDWSVTAGVCPGHFAIL